jgi:histidine phosphotransferase ChpT
LAFLLLQCVENALPPGGLVTVTRASDAKWTIVAEGERLNLDPALWQLVADPNASGPIGAPTARFALVAPLAAQLEREVTYRSSDTRTTISF